jgi:osmoprotectant transport system permease protein
VNVVARASEAPRLLAQEGVPAWDWISQNTDVIVRRGIEHLSLTAWAIGLGLIISIVLSVIALRYERMTTPITTVAGLVFTIPSIALFPVLRPYTGLTATTAIIGLTLYTLLFLVRNIMVGIQGVPAEVVEAAEGQGYARNRLFLEVQLPLALPVIIAGVRIATVTTIGLVTITGLIGYGGFGFFIFDGLRSNLYVPKLLVGALAPMVMALVADGALQVLERALTPWSRRSATV